MDFTGLLVLAALYALLNLIGRSQQKRSQEAERRRAARTEPPARLPPVPHEPGSLDATQQEGSRLEMMLRQLERALEEGSPGQATTLSPPQKEAGRSTGRPRTLSLPEEEEIE